MADENGSNDPLRRYTDKTLVIVLPGDLTVFDIGNHDIIILLPSMIGNILIILTLVATVEYTLIFRLGICVVCGVLRGLWSYRDSKELKCSTIITNVRNRATGINIRNSKSYYPVSIYYKSQAYKRQLFHTIKFFFRQN